MSGYGRKMQRAGARRAESRAARLFHMALREMSVLEETFCQTLNALPFWKRLLLAARLIVRRMRPTMPPPAEAKPAEEAKPTDEDPHETT